MLKVPMQGNGEDDDETDTKNFFLLHRSLHVQHLLFF